MNSAVLRAFEADYPGILSESNLDEILRSATQMLQDEEEEKSEESLTQSMWIKLPKVTPAENNVTFYQAQ